MLRLLLQCITWLLYAVFAVIVLYFPISELLTYFALETRIFRFEQRFLIEDALLPLFVLALIYGTVTGLRRKIERAEAPGREAHSSEND